VELKLAGAAMDSRSKVKSAASRLFFVTDFSLTKVFGVTRFFGAEKLFIVARFFFVTGTIVPVPIPCVPNFLGSRPDFFCSEVWKGCPNADAEWGLVLRATTGDRVRMRSVKNRLESC
jgi:hypothetical protein